MDEVRERLTRCFNEVFPGLTNDQVAASRIDSIAAWDSVASTALFSAVEQEFGVLLPLEQYESFLSFSALYEYLCNGRG
jgi:acyl carrier protein